MVEAQNARKTTKPEAESKGEDGHADIRKEVETKTTTEGAGTADTAVGKSGAGPEASKKRGRDEAEDEEGLPEAKKVDTKTEEGDAQESMES